MQYYRLYNLSAAGAIQGATNRPFENDGEAVDHARMLLALYPAVEIWQTDRLVDRVGDDQHCRAA
jgi:hypothetical protein